MKKTYVSLGLVATLSLLASCGNTALNQTPEQTSTVTNLETNQEVVKVETGNTVSVHYTGTLEDGEKFDSSLDRGTPLEFTAGAGQMIAGFDAGVMGMQVGEKKTIEIEPADGYGEYDETKMQTVEKSTLASFEAAGYKLEAGETIPTQFGQIAIKEVDGENITLDLNHPLAGKKLMFDVELLEIK